MKLKDAMRALEACGTAQNRKVYPRHGVRAPLFGVSFADLDRLRKQIGVDPALAQVLWETGNHDARMLAARLADADGMGARQLDAWARDLDNYILADTFGDLAARTRHARARAEKWSRAKGEWAGRVGWRLVAHLAMRDPEMPEAYFAEKLQVIEREIHGRKNRVRDAMNSALIAIGLRSPALERQALAAAARIGRVLVDHGETNCQTPDAADYLRRAAARRRR